MPSKILIVIPVYGVSDVLKLCLDQLNSYVSEHLDVEIILTDNTEDLYQKKLIQSIASEKYNNVYIKYIDMMGNKGFAAACNAGIKLKREDQDRVILLNSDAIVASDFLPRLVASEADITGIVTNRAGNIQDVNLLSPIDETKVLQANSVELEKISTYAQHRALVFENELWNLDFVTFFCVSIKSTVFEKIGFLDENFWPGGYEDDDFCIRAKKHGLTIVLDRSIFVYHLGSASFAQNPIEVRTAWNIQNRTRLEKKHNLIWESHEKEIEESARRDTEMYNELEKAKVAGNLNFISPQKVGEVKYRTAVTVRKIRSILGELKDNYITLKSIDPDLVVLSSKFPVGTDLSDGYFLRVKQVDDLFEKLSIKRIYVNTSLSKRDLRILSLNSFEITFSNRYNLTFFLILSLIKVNTFYVHSILRLQNSYFRRSLKLLRAKIFLDIHGVVPEEARLSNGFLAAQYLEVVEREVLSMSPKLISVTNRMTHHFVRKYSLSESNSVVFSTTQSFEEQPATEKKADTDFVYIGGIHPWQNLKFVVETAQNELKSYSWLFIVPNVNDFKSQYGPLGRNISVKSAKGGEADKLLQTCRFGILVRENSIVNQVACPTKISDYVKNGCIPITGEGVIGGIEDLGLEFLKLNKIICEGVPSQLVTRNMAESNLEKYKYVVDHGADRIKQILECEILK